MSEFNKKEIGQNKDLDNLVKDSWNEFNPETLVDLEEMKAKEKTESSYTIHCLNCHLELDQDDIEEERTMCSECSDAYYGKNE